MVKQPGNCVCCDCSCKMVTWASINIGCFLCYECAGQHRNLGTHISQVRSLTLDRWKPQWLQNMIGNQAVNKKYLARLPPNLKQPDEHDQSGREHWIKWKYQDKKWYSNVPIQQQQEQELSHETTTSVSQQHIQDIQNNQNIQQAQQVQQVQQVENDPFKDIFGSSTQQQPQIQIQQSQPTSQSQPQYQEASQSTLTSSKSQKKINELDDLLGFFEQPVIEQQSKQEVVKRRLQFDW